MNTNMKSIESCSHSCTAHVFQSPCCKKLNLIKKIAIVAFHILTLFIPFIISKVISCCFSRSLVRPDKAGENLQKTGVESVQSTLKSAPDNLLPKPKSAEETAVSKNGEDASVATVDKDNEQLTESKTSEAQDLSPTSSTEIAETPQPDVNNVETPISASEPTVVIVPKLNPMQEAFAFAEKLLEEPLSKIIKTESSKNAEIGFILNLQKKFDAELNEALKASENPWKDQKVLKIADAMMKVSYYAACKVLEELPTYIKKLKADGKNKTEGDIFRDVENYQYQAFEHFTYGYHSIRSGKHWGEIVINTKPTYQQECWKYSKKIDGVDEFYKEGTMLNAWRVLYNDYCGRFAPHTSHLEFNPNRVTKDLTAAFKPAPEFHLNIQKIDVYHCNHHADQEDDSNASEQQIALAVVKQTFGTKSLYGTLDLHVFADKKLGFRKAPKLPRTD